MYKINPTFRSPELLWKYNSRIHTKKINEFIRSLQVERANEYGQELSNVKVRSFLENVDQSSFWSYSGSLTTPPCLEDISWTVLNDV